jgi:hypothetical protein
MMGASQFHSPAHLGPDGVNVDGPHEFVATAEGSAPKVEYRFLLIQGNVVAKGSGDGWNTAEWHGSTDEGHEGLQEGQVLAVGLAISTSTTDPPGFTTFSWSEQIELKRDPAEE